MKADKYARKRMKEVNDAGFSQRWGAYRWVQSDLRMASEDSEEPQQFDIVLVMNTSLGGEETYPALALIGPADEYQQRSVVELYSGMDVYPSRWSLLPRPPEHRNSGELRNSPWVSVDEGVPEPNEHLWLLAYGANYLTALVIPKDAGDGRTALVHPITILGGRAGDLYFGDYIFNASHWAYLPTDSEMN